MTDPAPDAPRPQGFDGPTRDIRLPPAPGSPPLVVRPEWSSFTGPPAAADPAPPSVAPAQGTLGPPTRAQRLANEPTDELVPPGGGPREPTLKFDHGTGAPSRPAPVAPAPGRPERSRKWPWVVLTLLPVMIIVGSGIWLLVLLSHG